MLSYHPVTIAINLRDNVRELVRRSTERFKQLNGVEVQIITEKDFDEKLLVLEPFPHYAKAWVWNYVPETVDRILYFDADVIPIRPIETVPDADFAAAQETKWARLTSFDVWPSLQRSGIYFNVGLFFMHRKLRNCFDRVKFHLSLIRDQMQLFATSLINLFVQYAAKDFQLLSKQWNYQVENDTETVSDPYFVHMAGAKRKYLLMWFLLDLLDKYDAEPKIGGQCSQEQTTELKTLLSKFVETAEGRQILNNVQG